MTRMRLTAAVALAMVAGLVASGCDSGGSSEVTTADARAVSADESQALAMMRVRNLEEGARTVAFDVTDRGTQVTFDGWFDYATASGYGLLTTDTSRDLIQWNHSGLAAANWDSDTAPLPPPAPDSAQVNWSSGPLDPSSSRVHSVLAVVAALGSDRPENPLLLSGAGALWLAERTLAGTELMVIAGPPSEEALAPGESADPAAATIRYWIEDTGLAHRVDVRVGGTGGWTEVSFGDADGITIPGPGYESDNSL